jgi:sugar phosphate isomerase/epimerase
MQISGAHLTYCTNIHPGESWDEVFENVRTHVLAVKAQVAPDEPFGVGLRLSARAARSLRELDRLEVFKEFLASQRLYVFTINGFPYGPFHGQPVKAAVYRPDWSMAERARYTTDLAQLLAALLPEASTGSISTVPGGFKADNTGPAYVGRVARQILDQAIDLHRLLEQSGREIALALEPEPCCLLETTDETLLFFEQQLWSGEARRHVAQGVQCSLEQAELIIRRHVGVCLDTCHAAIEFEDADETLDRLLGAGIRIPKIQLSTGLRLPEPSPDALQALQAYDEPVYLHQVVARTRDRELLRFVDLSDGFASREARAAEEWRVHFHVPLYHTELGPFTNTQAFLARVLDRQRRHALTTQLEVETYTWDVLPPEQRSQTLVSSIARELNWVTERLGP